MHMNKKHFICLSNINKTVLKCNNTHIITQKYETFPCYLFSESQSNLLESSLFDRARIKNQTTTTQYHVAKFQHDSKKCTFYSYFWTNVIYALILYRKVKNSWSIWDYACIFNDNQRVLSFSRIAKPNTCILKKKTTTNNQNLIMVTKIMTSSLIPNSFQHIYIITSFCLSH